MDDTHPLVRIRFRDHWGDIASWITADTVRDYLPPVGELVGWMIPWEEHGIDDHVVIYSKCIGQQLGGVFGLVASAIVDIAIL